MNKKGNNILNQISEEELLKAITKLEIDNKRLQESINKKKNIIEVLLNK